MPDGEMVDENKKHSLDEEREYLYLEGDGI